MAVQTHSFYSVDLIDDGKDQILNSYKRNGSYEEHSIQEWIAHCVQGQSAIDLGAYTGIYTLLALNEGCFVDSYEPVPVTFSRLCENIRLRSWRNMSRSFNYAIDDIEGFEEKREIYFNNANVYNSAASLVQHKPSSRHQTVYVRGNIEEPAGKVCCIKVDVERKELAVLKILADVIERNNPFMIVESLSEETTVDIQAFLSQYGYVFSMDGRNILCYPT